jgi:NitT/TauT family transport system permease protein
MKPMLEGRDLLPILAPVMVGIVILGIWQLTCTVLALPDYLFPAPTHVWQALMADWRTLLHALVGTLEVTLLAFALAVVCGTLIALLFVQSRLIEISLFPYAIMLQVTPIVAIAPLIIIMIDDTFVSLVLCAAVVAVFPIISNTTIGLRTVDPGLLAYFRMNKASRWQQLVRLRIPSALPFFFAGLRIASGLSLIGAVVAEFVAGTGGRSAGLAYEILQASFQLDVPRMFAALLLITLTGIALALAMAGLTRVALRWHGSAAGDER